MSFPLKPFYSRAMSGAATAAKRELVTLRRVMESICPACGGDGRHKHAPGVSFIPTKCGKCRGTGQRKEK